MTQAATAVARLDDELEIASKVSGPVLPSIRADALVLRDREFRAEIERAVIGGELVRTIEGASTLTLNLHDRDRALLNSGFLTDDELRLQPITLAVPAGRRNVWFSLAALGKQGHELTLTFEDREAAWLRRYNRPRKAFRDQVTRAEFILSLVREVKEGRIRFHSPELRKRQPIASSRDRRSRPARDRDREFGLAPRENLRIKGVRATPYQLKVAERVLNVGVSMDAAYVVLVAEIVTIIEEATARNPPSGLDDSVGAFQQRRSQGWPATRDIETDAKEFVKRARQVHRQHPGWEPWRIAHEVQRNFDTATNGKASYGRWVDEGKAIVDAYAGGRLRIGATVSGEVPVRYPFTRGQSGKRENSWEAIQRLAEEVAWRAFMVEGTLYYISEEDLFRSRPRMRISEDAPAVDWVDFDWNTNRKIGELSVTCRVDMWLADPGSVVVVEDAGPASGRWLVTEVRRGMFDAAAEITLRKPMQEKPEPAPEMESGSIDRPGTRHGGVEGDATRRLIEECRRFSGPYDWGGGHGPPLSQLSAGQGLDCSSSTSLALWRAGLFRSNVAWVSGQFATSYGKPGRGREFTVWANDGHVFIQFEKGGRFDTGGPGGGNGPRLRPESRPTGGFTPRHWPGL